MRQIMFLLVGVAALGYASLDARAGSSRRVAKTRNEKRRTVRVAVCQILSIDGDREGNFTRIEYARHPFR